MKSFLNSPGISGFTALLMLAALFINAVVLYYQILQRRKVIRLILRVFVIFAAFYVLECSFLCFDTSVKISAFNDFFLKQKAVFALGDALAILFISLLGIKSVFEWRNRHITPLSVKESIDSLPMGMCCYSEGGLTRLVNIRMEELCNDILGNTLNNGEEFEWALKNGKGADYIKDGENPMVRLGNGEIISFTFRDIDTGNIKLKEILANDITEEYAINRELEKENVRLSQMNERLRAINSDIARVTAEKETLEMKLGIHDNFGQFLLAARHYLNEIKRNYYDDESIIESRRELCGFWPGSGFYEDAGEAMTKDGYEELYYAAEKVGVRIICEGEAWYDEEGARLAQTAIHECLTNTIRHAGGDELYVRFYEGKERMLEITNNGREPEKNVKPRGGLLFLSELSKESGTVMELEWKPRFRLTIKRR